MWLFDKLLVPVLGYGAKMDDSDSTRVRKIVFNR